MKQFKRAQVIMLPTNKSNIVLINLKKEFLIGTETYKSFLQGGKDWVYNKSVTDNSESPQHLYIISDDEIKEGDWYLNSLNSYTIHCYFKGEKLPNYGIRKIIATTESTMINYSIKSNPNSGISTYIKELPQPSQQFIEKYIESYNKGEIITDVLVEYEIKSNAGLGYNEYVYLQHIDEKRYIPIKIEVNIHQDIYQLGKEDVFEDFEIDYNLKTNSKDNTITIKKVKDNWNREEIINFLNEYNNQIKRFGLLNENNYDYLNQWIKENL